MHMELYIPSDGSPDNMDDNMTGPGSRWLISELYRGHRKALIRGIYRKADGKEYGKHMLAIFITIWKSISEAVSISLVMLMAIWERILHIGDLTVNAKMEGVSGKLSGKGKGLVLQSCGGCLYRNSPEEGTSCKVVESYVRSYNLPM